MRDLDAESLWIYTPLFLVTGIGLGAGERGDAGGGAARAASGVTLTSLVMLGAVSVAIAASVLELLAGSPGAAASDKHALDVILRSGAVFASLPFTCGGPSDRRKRGPAAGETACYADTST